MTTFSRRRILQGAGALSASVLAPHLRAQTAKVIRIGVTTRAESSEGRGAQFFADTLSKLSGGKLKAECLYNSDSGKLNDAKGSMYQALLADRVNIVVAPTTQAVDAIGAKDMALWDMPFMFNNTKEVDAVLDGPIGQKMLDKLATTSGLQGLCYWENGFRQFCSTDKPLENIEDFKGVKIRVIPNPIYTAVFKTLGATPVSIAFDKVYDAFKNQEITAAEISFGPAYDKKWHEFIKFFSISNYVYSPYMVSSSKKWWDALTADERQQIQAALVAARDAQRGFARKAEGEAMEAMKAAGVTIRKLDWGQNHRISERLVRISSTIARDVGMTPWMDVNLALNKMRG